MKSSFSLVIINIQFTLVSVTESTASLRTSHREILLKSFFAPLSIPQYFSLCLPDFLTHTFPPPPPTLPQRSNSLSQVNSKYLFQVPNSELLWIPFTQIFLLCLCSPEKKPQNHRKLARFGACQQSSTLSSCLQSLPDNQCLFVENVCPYSTRVLLEVKKPHCF